MAGHALAGQADVLAFTHTRRDTHAERAGLHLRMPLVVEVHGAQADVARGAFEGVYEIDVDGGMVVFAAGPEVWPGPVLRAVAEQRREEFAELGFLARRGGAVVGRAHVGTPA